MPDTPATNQHSSTGQVKLHDHSATVSQLLGMCRTLNIPNGMLAMLLVRSPPIRVSPPPALTLIELAKVRAVLAVASTIHENNLGSVNKILQWRGFFQYELESLRANTTMSDVRRSERMLAEALDRFRWTRSTPSQDASHLTDVNQEPG